MTNLCSPSTMCGPFCSVPAVPTMIVVVPALIRSRTSAHVSSSSSTVSGGLPAGAVAGADAGRCAEPDAMSDRMSASVAAACCFMRRIIAALSSFAVLRNDARTGTECRADARAAADCWSGARLYTKKGCAPVGAQPVGSLPESVQLDRQVHQVVVAALVDPHA